MSYTSKRTIVSIVAGIILVAAYIIFILGENSPGAEDLKSWAIAILVFIGIGIAINIAVQILFHIFFAVGIAVKEECRESDKKECDKGENDKKENGKKENENKIERIIASSMVEDERSKFINLKSSRAGYICAGISFIAALFALILNQPAIVFLHILFFGFAAGSIFEGFLSIYYYEKGIHIG
ncbi:MAG: hypothetical protein FWH41_01575 [Treponema sp.]|nr:hypothetical protein [Treponema sp.]